MIHGELFAGISGFGLGLEQAGFQTAWAVEIDTFAQKVLRQRGVAQVFGDIKGCGAHNLTPVDILTFGFPCQDLSVAGKRSGLAGERSGLFYEAIRVAKEIRPPWAIAENVPGLVSSNRGSDMALVIAGLRECWPVVGWRILDSRYFGVAQRRRRVFFVCGPTEAGVAQVLALTEGGAGDLEAGGEAGAQAPGAAVISALHPGKGGGGGHQYRGGDHNALVAHALSAGAGGSKFGSGRDGQDDFVIAQCHGTNVGPMGTLRKGNGTVGSGIQFVAETLSAGSNPHSNMAGRRREDDVNLVATQPEQFQITCDCGHTFIGTLATVCLGCGQFRSGVTNEVTHAPPGEGHDASEDGTGRWTPIVFTPHRSFNKDRTEVLEGWAESPIANALHTKSGIKGHNKAPAVASSSSVRRLTPLECERLQSFPDGWTCLCQPLEAYAADPDAAALRCSCPDTPRYRALGNAVTVNVITWLGQRLKEVIA